MPKRAYRRRYDYQNQERYRIFLKQQLLEQTPRLYTVAAHRQVLTTDGLMYVLKIVQATLDDPTIEVIAECRLNGEYVYLWRDHCWGIATDAQNQPVINYHLDLDLKCGPTTLYEVPAPCNKVLLLYQIGSTQVE